MSLVHAQWFEYSFAFPTQKTPAWQEKVDRWYQLDAMSFGLTEAVWEWREKFNFQLAPTIVMASPGASNESDFAFASQGASSAQKFAHTLSNVRLSPVAQAMNWQGVSLCLQYDPYTLQSGLQEAVALLEPAQSEKGGQNGSVTLLSVFEKKSLGILPDSPESYLAFALRLEKNRKPAKNDATCNKLPVFSIEVDETQDLNRPDAQIWAWLKSLIR